MSGPDEGEAPPPDGGAWDDPAGRAFVERLERRLALPLQADAWADPPPTPGEQVDAFAARRALEATIAGRPRSAAPDDRRCPEPLKQGMRSCQKPFHLWNVERMELDGPPGPERLEGYVVGRAAALPEELRPPRDIEKATKGFVDWVLGQQLRRELDRRDLQARRRLLVDPLPFGKADEEEAAPQGRTVRIDIAGGGKLPPGFDPRRFRGPPELMAALARAQAPRGDDAGPPGGLELSQPDEEDDRAGPPAGLELSQPDDD